MCFFRQGLRIARLRRALRRSQTKRNRLKRKLKRPLLLRLADTGRTSFYHSVRPIRPAQPALACPNSARPVSVTPARGEGAGLKKSVYSCSFPQKHSQTLNGKSASSGCSEEVHISDFGNFRKREAQKIAQVKDFPLLPVQFCDCVV